MFPGTFGDGRESRGYADIIDRGTVRLRTRDQILLLVFTILGLILALGLPASTVGVVSEMGADGQALCAGTDVSMVPQSVADDAARLATRFFGKHGEKHRRFVDELLATYVKCHDKEVVVLFSPGGWGYGPMDLGRPWGSVLNGIQTELSDCGVDSEILIYQRSIDSPRGCWDELTEIFRDYASKARILAARVHFLTEHSPDLKVVIVGESVGAQISGEAMEMLSNNPRVFDIQIGPPFWYRQTGTERRLVIENNGIAPDSFSRCDVVTIIGANLLALAGKSKTNDARGTILKYLRAPGHDYWWDYPGVSSQIIRFFEETVGIGGTDSHHDVTAGDQVTAVIHE